MIKLESSDRSLNFARTIYQIVYRNAILDGNGLLFVVSYISA